MGWAVMIGLCVRCSKSFGFNPHKVPSVRVNGEREPLCEACFEELNRVREGEGLDPLVALPGAYEPIPEDEL